MLTATYLAWQPANPVQDCTTDQVAPPSPVTVTTISPDSVATEADVIQAGDKKDEEEVITAIGEDGEIITVTARLAVPEDPLAGINAETFEIVQDIDEAVVGPVALAYGNAVPKPARAGIRNFFANLAEPIVFLNFLLQLKPGKAAETLGRFATNSTLGLAGLIDVAKEKPFNLPRRRNGFGNTLGFYGVKPGPYLYLPLIGSTTLRDLIGGGIDLLVLPVAVGKPFNDPTYAIPAGIITGLGSRVDANDEIRRLRDQTKDPYTAYREEYLKRREREINELRGKLPEPLTPVTGYGCPGSTEEVPR